MIKRQSAPGSNTQVVPAPAKVNVFLRVLGSRPDGYHDIETLVAPISLADRLTLHAFADPGQFRTISLSLDVQGDPDLASRVPAGDSNLILRAAAALAAEAGIRGFADIVLHKLVPVAAGLGGGSSDAAAALLALNDLWGCAMDDRTLREVGARVGSDVPALMMRGPALARGRGERVEPVILPSMRWLVAPLPFEVRTKDAFRWWDEDGGHTGPDSAGAVEAARRGDVRALGPALFNDLEDPVTRRHPEVRRVIERLTEAGAVGVVMCGSGPTVAALLAEDVEVSGAIEVRSGLAPHDSNVDLRDQNPASLPLGLGATGGSATIPGKESPQHWPRQGGPSRPRNARG